MTPGRDEQVSTVTRVALKRGVGRMSNARLETALIAACRKGDESAVAHALSVLPSGQVDAVDVDGLSALVHATFCLRGSTGACGAAYERISRLLLKLGARVDFVDRNGSNALHHASFMGHTRMAAALCEHVVPSAIDTERANGESALSVAAFRGHAGVAQLLLRAGASVNLQSPKGGTALMLGASQGHAPLVELLLKAAADTGLRAASGATALQIAEAQGHREVAGLLRGKAPCEAVAAAAAAAAVGQGRRRRWIVRWGSCSTARSGPRTTSY